MASDYATITAKLLGLARARDDIQSIIVIGSQARNDRPADAYSDLDLIMVVNDPGIYLSSNHWLEEVGRYWISFSENTLGGGKERRVLFEDALDVDFLFFTETGFRQALLQTEVQALFSRGYRVVLDKGDIADSLPTPSASQVACAPPAQDVLSNLVNDFWYHAVWTTKKLQRGEIWIAKSCLDGYMKGHLLRVIEWQTRLAKGPDCDTWHAGRFLEQWADERVLQALRNTYAHYEPDDIAKALLATMALFRSLAIEVAERSSLSYPRQADDYAMAWVHQSLANRVSISQPKAG